MLTTLLLAAALDMLPLPPGYAPKTVTLSPKATELKASLGTPMVKAFAAQTAVVGPTGILTNLILNAGQVTLQWQPGAALFQVQASALDGNWQNKGGLTAAHSKTFPVSAQHFFRISQSNSLPLNLNPTNQPRLNWTQPELDMSDSLQTFTVQKSTDNGTTFSTIGTVAAGGPYQFSDSTLPPVQYKVLETTLNGVVVPFTIASLNTVAAGTTLSGSFIHWAAQAYPDNCKIFSVLVRGSDLITVGFAALNIDFGAGVVACGHSIAIMKYTGGLPAWPSPYLIALPADIFPGKSAIDSDGNIYVCGSFSGKIDFGNGQVSSPNNVFAGFVVKINANRTYGWARTFGATGVQTFIRDVCVSTPSGLICASGDFAGTVDFGTGNKTSNGGFDVVVVRMNKDTGLTSRADTFGGTGNERGHVIAPAPSDAVVVGGQMYSASVDFGGITKTLIGGADLYIAKYDSAGALKWVQNYGGSDPTTKAVAGVTPNSLYYLNGNIGICGSYSHAVNLGGSDLAYREGDFTESTRMFNAKYSDLSTSISHVWSRGDGDNTRGYAEVAFATVLDSSGNLFMTGQIATGYDWGNGTGFMPGIPTGNYENPVTAKFRSSDGACLWVKRFYDGEFGSNGTALNFLGGKLIAAGYFGGHMDFQPNIGPQVGIIAITCYDSYALSFEP